MQHGHCRRKADRRQSHQPFHFYSVIGRRRRTRRQAGNPHPAGDSHPPLYLAISVAILSLCVADAFNTLQLLQAGGKELNPLMDVLISADIRMFVAAKFALTGLGLLVLVGYRNRIFIRPLKAQHLLWAIFAMYAALIVYQSLLMPDYVFGIVFPL